VLSTTDHPAGKELLVKMLSKLGLAGVLPVVDTKSSSAPPPVVVRSSVSLKREVDVDAIASTEMILNTPMAPPW